MKKKTKKTKKTKIKKKKKKKNEDEDEEEEEEKEEYEGGIEGGATVRGGEEARSLGTEIICRYNRLPAGKKVKRELPFAMRCYVDGVSLLIFNSLPAYLVRSERDL
ncbi:hypothetical protein HZH68_013349 [Vespula germanica]|uniref:Uncharacterized protein n=1 Tax=Vespula germanica TaxID=30212 RepID=A0A834JFJ0_VESGE|nr:hypothetical protein HZH68_013349 [Vespula germanica]